MCMENCVRDSLTVNGGDDVEEPFLATKKLEQTNDRALHRSRRHGRVAGLLVMFSMLSCFTIILGLVLTIIVMSMVKTPWAMTYNIEWLFSDWRKPDNSLENLARQSSSFLQSVIPRPCHSHNDYWRKVPVYSALHAGCTGIEADVWLFDKSPEIYVGHEPADLTPRRTFRSLYVTPLVRILEERNAGTPFRDGESRRGVFDTFPEQTLVLLVDIKTDGAKTIEHVQAQLEPLRAGNWLTTVEDGILHKRQVTVVGTGRTPFDLLMQNSTYRDIFFDAPLSQLYEDPDMPDARDDSLKTFKYNTTNSFYASVNFKRAMGFVWSSPSKRQLHLIRGQIRGAHERGLKVRYWNTPAWPPSLRNRIWDILMTEGADILNVDNLEAVAQQWEKHPIHSNN